jgi:ATP-dependent Lhr-like helicase
VAERFFDEAGGMQLVLHAPFGARTNRALGLALRKRFCRSFDFELQAAATDEGVLLSLGPQHSFPLESIFELVSVRGVEETLAAAALQSPMFPVRWRWDATRALAIPRMMGGKKTPPPIARMRADDLLAAVFPQAVACQDNADLHPPAEIPDHPLVKEALRDCLHEAMDLPGLSALLARVEAGEVRLVARDTAEPSPMSHEILGARPWAYLDDAPLEERRARAVVLRRALPSAEAADLGALDPAAVQSVAEQVWPDVRDADEMHDVLLDLGVLPARDAGAWTGYLESLVEDGRAARARRERPSEDDAWVAAERVALLAALDPTTRLDPPLRPLLSESVPDSPEDAAARALRGWLPRLGPMTAAGLASRLGLSPSLVQGALVALEREGLVLRGQFLPGAPYSGDAPHWCERGVLARIHRMTLGRLRREIEPVGVAELIRFLTRWQHALAGQKLHGRRGLAEVVGQLQGFHAPAGAWEREILPARLAGYDPAALDEACMHGELAWGRLSVMGASGGRPPGAGPEEAPRRRSAPTRNAPVTLALRSDLGWLAAAGGPHAPLGPSAQALVDVLARVGASFLSDLAAMTGRLPREVESAMWELVSAGAVTCDGFAGLRALVDPDRSRHGRRPGLGGGRWALLARPSVHRAELLEKQADQLLRRWGVVFRDLLAREAGAPAWRELLLVYRRREARGEIRGGRFVTGFSGEQFAAAEAVAALRGVRRAPKEGHERVELSAADPLNLVGVLTPGARVPATLVNRVAYLDGIPVAPQGLRAVP